MRLDSEAEMQIARMYLTQRDQVLKELNGGVDLNPSDYSHVTHPDGSVLVFKKEKPHVLFEAPEYQIKPHGYSFIAQISCNYTLVH